MGGGAVFTSMWAVFAINVLNRLDFFMCPQKSLIHYPFEPIFNLTCADSIKKQFMEVVEIPLVEWQVTALSMHAFILALFASLIAPFGGFFASGFKRAFRLKDFGDWIPGHGGVTDRFDCQIVMGMFTFMYLQTFVYSGSGSLEALKRNAAHLSGQERQELISYLQKLNY